MKGDLLNIENFNEITLQDFELYSTYIKNSSYFTGLWASNFTYIWCLSKKTNLKVYYKFFDEMLVTFIRTKSEFMYIWCLPFGKGNADHVVKVLLKSLEFCKNWNEENQHAKKPFIYLLNEPQRSFLSTSRFFGKRLKITNHKSREIIWDIPKIVERKGKNFSEIRYLLNRLRKNYPTLAFREFTPSDFNEVFLLKKRWNQDSGRKYKQITDDHTFNLVFNHYQSLKEMIFVATIDEKIVGFVTGAILPNGISWGCIAKGDQEVKGIYEYLYTEFARVIAEQNPEVTLLHTGSDGNHEGLRNFKDKFRPAFRLNLYSLRLR